MSIDHRTRLRPLTLGDSVRRGALQFPGRKAVRMLDGEALSYAQLHEHTDRLANALREMLRVGDRVAIWMENSLEYLEAYLACLKAGLVVVQVNIRHTPYEAQFQLEHSGAAALIFDDAVAGRVESLPGLDAIRLLVATGEERVGNSQSFGAFRARGRATLPDDARSADDVAVLAYTSGTTGFPKGARLTQSSIRSIGQTNALANRYSLGSTQVFGLSLSFAASIPAHVLPHLAVGGTTILMPSFDTAQLVDAIDRYHANFTILPSPPIVEFCATVRDGGYHLNSLVSLLHSAGKAPAEHLELLTEVIGSRLVEGWGMTENSGGLVAATTSQDYRSRRPGIFSSTGRPVPDTVVEVHDSDGEHLPHDGTSVGQLVFRSQSLADGYWNDPEATAKAFRNGWYHTGDLGTIDPEGYIEVLDRRTDLIISGGMNVYPSEVERTILQVPGIAECTVVGFPHGRWGQTPVAFLVRTNEAPANGRPSLSEVGAHCRERLAGYKQPTEFHFLDALPRNAGGKVMRHLLRRADA